mgnify:CR=1 FL=1
MAKKSLSAQRVHRRSERQGLRNTPIQTAVRTHLRIAESYIADKDPENARAAVARAVHALDKAWTKGVIHKNKASRHKSRLMQKLNTLLAGASAQEPAKA